MKTLTPYLKKVSAISAIWMMMVVFMPAVPAYAQPDCPEGTQEVSVPVDQAGTRCVPINESGDKLENNPIFFYLRNIIIFLSGGVGLAVVGGIIYGSYMYITARGNAGQTQKGQEIIINSIIGLILYIFMFAILQFLIPGGVFK